MKEEEENEDDEESNNRRIMGQKVKEASGKMIQIRNKTDQTNF